MASIKDIDAPSINYYDPAEEVRQLPLATYKAHIAEVNTRERVVRGKYKARIFNFTVEIADNSGTEYEVKDILGDTLKVDGKTFQGRQVRGNGIFYFLNPGPNDDFKPNPSGNAKYLLVCKALGVECPKIEISDGNGGTKLVTQLPELQESDFMDKPVLATVGMSREFLGKEGDMISLHEVKKIQRWEDGKSKQVNPDSIKEENESLSSLPK